MPSSEVKSAPLAVRIRKALNGLARNRRVGGFLVILGSLFFVYSLHDSFVSAGQYARDISTRNFIPGILAATAGMYLFALIFAVLLNDELDRPVALWRAIVAYNLSAIARYVPGRIWGVFYQVDRLGNPGAIVRANVRLAAAAMTHSTGIAGAILVYFHGQFFGNLRGAAAALVYFIALAAVCLILVMRRPNFSERPSAECRRSNPVMTIGAFQLEWITFILVWSFLLKADSSWADIVVVAAAYSLAWMIGIALVIFPAGLVAREGSFVMAGEWLSYPVPKLLYWAAAARVCFTLAELLAALSAFGFGELLRRRSPAPLNEQEG